MSKFGFTISGYTTSHNCIDMNYPYKECINSLLNFCDEVVVVDSGSTDGSIEAFQKLAKDDSRIRFFVDPVDFTHPRWAIHNDGDLKGRSRARCVGDYCWQMDLDEVVPPEDAWKVQKLPQLMGNKSLIMLPMVEFWGSFDYIRGDFFTWKPRFSKNDKRIIHGIPKEHKMYDAQGLPYIRPFFSDGCNFIWSDTETDVELTIPLPVSYEEFKGLTDTQYDQMFLQCLDQLPFVLHVSWLDFKRKIRHYKKFWQRYQQSMYNLALADTAQTNVMFDKPWAEVTEKDIEERAAQLMRIGPRSFHHKIDPSKFGRTVRYSRPIPQDLKEWHNRTIATNVSAPSEAAKPTPTLIVTAEHPLVSAIVPSYNKAQYLNESVGSILVQEYKNIEILIVNDGSPDDTNQAAHQIIKDNPSRRISLLEKPNGGISDARNYGISRAQGTIIVALDGDDIALPTFVSKGWNQINAGIANLVCSNVEVFGVRTGEWVMNAYDPFYIRYDNSISTLTMYDKKLWEKTGGYKVSFPFVEDWEFFINCSRYDLKVARLQEKLFRYRASEDGLARLFQDKYRELLCMVSTANEDLYPLEEVLWAHEHLGTNMPDHFFKRFQDQDRLHPKEWLLKFWMALYLEKRGNIEEANRFYVAAMDLSNYKEWQPIFRLGMHVFNAGKQRESVEFFHQVRILKPEMTRIVRPMIEQVEKSAGNQTAYSH